MSDARREPRVLLLLLAASCGAAAAPADRERDEVIEEVENARRSVRLPETARAAIAVQTVGEEPVTGWVGAPGSIAFRDAAIARVGAPLAGRVEAVHVHVGDAVDQGVALFTIGSPDAAAMRAALASARSRQHAARLEVERQESLREAGVGLQSELVRAQAELAQADTEIERARVASRLIGRGAGGRVVVRAPLAGTVLSRRATAGTVVEPGDEALVEIGDPSALWVVVNVYEDELALVHPGASVDVFASTSTDALPGKVVRVAGPVEDRTRRAPVAIELDPLPPDVRAGMFVRARIETSAQGRTNLPASAVLVGDGGKTVVWVATDDDGGFEAREVTAGRAVDGRVPILAGVAPGDRVVVDNTLLLDAAADQLL